MDEKMLNTARRRYWKILEDTGDYIGWESEGGKDGVMNASLEDLISEAEAYADNHYNAIYCDNSGYEKKVYQKFKRFINRFSSYNY